MPELTREEVAEICVFLGIANTRWGFKDGTVHQVWAHEFEHFGIDSGMIPVYPRLDTGDGLLLMLERLRERDWFVQLTTGSTHNDYVTIIPGKGKQVWHDGDTLTEGLARAVLALARAK